jgi:hypothetical protein
MFVCCECCVLSGRGLCDGLITRPEESYRLWRDVVCDQETSKNEEAKARYRAVKIQAQWVVTAGKQTNKFIVAASSTSNVWDQKSRIEVHEQTVSCAQFSCWQYQEFCRLISLADRSTINITTLLQFCLSHRKNGRIFTTVFS